MANDEISALKKIAGAGYGRANADRLLDILQQRPELFPHMVAIYLSNEEPVSRRTAWAVDLYAELYPDKLIPYLDVIVERLPHFEHDGMKRHSLRMLARSPLPEARLGQLISLCFDILLSPSETPAVKVFAMEILYQASLMEHDIRQELVDSIEWRFREESPGVKVRGERILKKLYKDLQL